MTPKEKADSLYRIAYQNWALELSEHKNIIIAKSIAIYVVDETQNLCTHSVTLAGQNGKPALI